MTSLNRLIGLPVVLKGRRQGQVEQGILDPSGKSLRGLVIRNGIRGAKWLPASQISALGGVSVLTQTPPQRLPRNVQMRLGPVWDTSGLRLGMVTDVYLDDDLSVSALEISLGPLDDYRFGRMLTQAYTLLKDGSATKVLTSLDALTPLAALQRKEESHEPW
ncbi:MAG: hypothetical protein IJ461_03135 [Clostridia bacterium]|nr:hypothetical protein [Clostridia bacterium]